MSVDSFNDSFIDGYITLLDEWSNIKSLTVFVASRTGRGHWQWPLFQLPLSSSLPSPSPLLYAPEEEEADEEQENEKVVKEEKGEEMCACDVCVCDVYVCVMCVCVMWACVCVCMCVCVCEGCMQVLGRRNP